MKTQEVVIVCDPAEDQKVITFTLTSDRKIDGGMMIESLLNFIDHFCEEHGIEFEAEEEIPEPRDRGLEN